MQQLLSLVILTLLVLEQGLCSPAIDCVDDEAISPVCVANLEEYYAQGLNLPCPLNMTSQAAWAYKENVDPDRVPKVFQEAVCLKKHSCKGVGVESIPLAILLPVLRRQPGCKFQSFKLESVNIACICATT